MNDRELLEQLELVQEQTYNLSMYIQRNNLEDKYSTLIDLLDNTTNCISDIVGIEPEDDFPFDI